MPIGKKIPAMENEEKIGVVSEGLMNNKAAQKIRVLTMAIMDEKEAFAPGRHERRGDDHNRRRVG